MPKGNCPTYLLNNPNIDKPIEDVWEDIQKYTGEVYPDESSKYKEMVDFIVVLPPLKYEGKFIKGLYMCRGIEYVQSLYPNHKELFIPMSYTMWSSLPWSETADVYLSCYNNPEREAWFKNRYPEKSDKIFIGKQDADFTHEYAIAPVPDVIKNIDVLSVARLDKGKNLPLLVEALKLYEKKYGNVLKMTLITGQIRENFGDSEKEIVAQMAEVAGSIENLKRYVDFVGHVNYGSELSTYYSRAKCIVLTSIFEGKNRMINEALCCNVPVVVFKDLCNYTRGDDEIFPDNAGVFAESFTPESLADAMHYTVENYTKFTPRRSYLKKGGRINFVNECIDSIPYYRDNLPEYVPGRIQDNLWVNLAVQANYQMSLNDFIYGRNLFFQHVKVNEQFYRTMDFYCQKMDLIRS